MLELAVDRARGGDARMPKVLGLWVGCSPKRSQKGALSILVWGHTECDACWPTVLCPTCLEASAQESDRRDRIQTV